MSNAAAQMLQPRPGDWLKVGGFLWIATMPIAAFALARLNYSGLDLAWRTLAWPVAWPYADIKHGDEQIAQRRRDEWERSERKYATKRKLETARMAQWIAPPAVSDRPAADQ
jgi:hypothetical protein